MKRVIISVFAVLALCFLLVLIPGGESAFAATKSQEKIKEEIENEVSESLKDLITSDLEEYFKELKKTSDYNFGDSLKGFIKNIIEGKTEFTADALLKMVSAAVKNNFLSILSSLSSIIALSILYGLSKHINSGFIKESTSQIVYFAVYGSIIATLGAIVVSAVSTTKKALGAISTLMDISMPIFITLITALGGVSGAAVYRPITLMVSSLIIKTIEYVVMPLFFSTVVFGMIGHLTNNVKLDKITKTLRSVANWLLGIMFSVVGMLMSAQGIVGASIDNVSIRSAKFALSSYVPILGGYLSDGFDIVLASGVLIKNALGLAGVMMLIAAVAGPVLKILVISLALRLAGGILEPVSDEKISGLLYTTGKNLMVLVSIILGLFFLVFVVFMLVITSCNAGVA
ncbi:MAG TPA: stage III sporulation protein AE [Clostridia bacterium]|jgi:stage III sporulation protein AE|nr:stage III sporulation protein AE [Clostridia bacterium]HOK81518.1 stage III sporulation protein AE [Clostridia bacterium]HOL60964.1 stage III sporulation protein AE [Clostridia bacterium]HPO53444.1 stage III sporulation protein AE [Clostridia bacterium]